MIQAYIIISSIISIVFLLLHKSKMDALDNFFGSVVAGIAFGWLVWPFCILAVIKQRKNYDT